MRWGGELVQHAGEMPTEAGEKKPHGQMQAYALRVPKVSENTK